MTVITPGHAEAPLPLPTVPVPAQWSPDSKSLLYIDTRRGISNLWRHSVAGGTATQITKFTNDRIFRYALSRDQKRWAIVRGEISRDVVLVSERK
jgi:Tol biopolymer transport system component